MRIKIASGDTGHRLVFQLVDLETGRPLNLSEDGLAASFHFVGEAGEEVFHLPCLALEPCHGLVAVEWPAVGLLKPGLYDGFFRLALENGKAITLPGAVRFEIAEALPCVDGSGTPIHSPARWDAVNGGLLIANADHPNVWHEVTIAGDPANPTIDIGAGVAMDGGAI
jgi:hypothetical protein